MVNIMRELKFRGMEINKNWHYGNLNIILKTNSNNPHHVKAGSYISNSAGMPFAYQVRPETVGQYIGIEDKNGKEIYRGDILEFDEKEWGCGQPSNLFIVEWDNHNSGWVGNGLFSEWSEYCKVIGNIYENPELIGE